MRCERRRADMRIPLLPSLMRCGLRSIFLQFGMSKKTKGQLLSGLCESMEATNNEYRGGLVSQAPAWLIWSKAAREWRCIGGAATRADALVLQKERGGILLPRGELPEWHAARGQS